MRTGGSLARAAFDQLPNAFKTMVRSTQTHKMQEENRASGQFIAERDQLREYVAYGVTDDQGFTRRPTTPLVKYCGVDEFEGRYYSCDIKNPNQNCPQFTPKEGGTARRACASCRHNWQAPDQLLLTVEQTLGRDSKGRPIREEVRQQLAYQAEGEYQDCVDGAGLVPTRPGILPLCEARSSEVDAQFVIGPIVNSSDSCDLWAAGTNQAKAETEAQLNALVARARQAAAARQNPSINPYADPLGMGNIANQIQGVQEAVANAEADLIEYCLLTLGVDRSATASVATRFASDVWYAQRQPTWTIEGGGPTLLGSAAQQQAANATSGGAQASEPFVVQQATIYKHPQIALAFFVALPQIRVHMGVVAEPALGAPLGLDVLANSQLLGIWLISAFEAGVWSQLYDANQSPLPLTFNIQPPETIYAAWY